MTCTSNLREAEGFARAADAGADIERNRRFVLQVVQPGLAGLMDGSVSTLAPLFAAAFAIHSNSQAFTVGLAAALGAGISMGFAEALSDDGLLSGRGSPLIRGLVCGLMTALGGLGHALPYLTERLAARVLDRHRRRRAGGCRRALDDCLDPHALHGNAVAEGCLPDRVGRRHRAHHGHPHRRGLSMALPFA